MKKVLVVIDAQNDFLTGALANPAAVETLPEVQRLVESAKNEQAMIIYTRDTHNADYLETHEGKNLPIPHCIENSDGWEIDESVAPGTYKNAFIIDKEQFGAYPRMWEDRLDRDYFTPGEHLDIHICGYVSSICVVSNALILRALYPEADITFHAYASAGLTPEDHAAACKVMECCQIKVLYEAI